MILSKICAMCSNPMDKGGRFCKACVKIKRKLSNQKYIAKFKKNSLCLSCGKPLDRKGVLCSKCSDLKSARRKIIYETRKANNICVKCGELVLDGKTSCLPCRIKYNEYLGRIKPTECVQCASPLDRGGKYCSQCARKRKHMNRTSNYYNRIANNLCTRCTGELDRKGSICFNCLIKHSKRQKEFNERKKLKKICRKCNSPVYDDKLFCKDCRIINNQRRNYEN